MLTRAYFNSFVLDLRSETLCRGNVEISIQPAAFQLLTYFVQNPGQLLTREQLIGRLWPDVFVGDEALSQMIRRVRRAVEDEGEQARLLVTVPRRGYRFVGDVQWVDAADDGSSGLETVGGHHTLDSSLSRGEGVGVSTAQPPALSPGVHAQRATRYVDEFIGRDQVLLLLERHLKEGVGLLTVLGPGGLGKTRLALEFGARQHGLGPVVFVDLSEVTELDGLALVISSALDVPIVDDPPHRNVDRIGMALAALGRRVVILDNFESLPPDAALVIRRWLQLAPQVFFLVTSRQRLGISGEVVLWLDSLSPDAACELFYRRAAFAGAVLARDGTEAAAVADLVQRLDRSPLAIELVAARAAILSVPQLVDNLSSRFLLLRNRQRDAVGRHRSLLAVVEASVERLDDMQRQILVRTAVLPGPFTLETISALRDFLGGANSVWVPDVLHDLVDCSLLGVRSFPDSTRLFVMQESVREYCLRYGGSYAAEATALLRDGLWRRLQDVVALPRPAADWPTLLEAAKASVGRDPQWDARVALLVAPWLHERGPRETGKVLLDKALENRNTIAPKYQVRLLMARAAYEPPVSVMGDEWLREAEELAAGLAGRDGVLEIGYIKVERLISQGRYRDAQALLGQFVLPPGRSRYLRNYGALVTLAVMHGLEESNFGDLLKYSTKIVEDTTEFQDADDDSEADLGHSAVRSEDIAARLADFRGHVLGEAGQFDEAIRSYEAALSTYRSRGRRRLQAVTLVNLASPLSFGKRDDEANRALESALEIFEDIGDARGVAAVLTNRSLALLLARRTEDARRDIERALPVAMVGELFGIEVVLRHNLSSVLWLQGSINDALNQVELALQLVNVHGMLEREKGLRLWCAGLYAALGDVDCAMDHLKVAKTGMVNTHMGEEKHASRLHEALEVICHHVDAAIARKTGDREGLARVLAAVDVAATSVGPQAALLASLIPR